MISSNSVAIGSNVDVIQSEGCISIGNDSEVLTGSDSSVVIGKGSTVNGIRDISVGANSRTEGSNSITFGTNASARGVDCAAIGTNSNAYSDFNNGAATAVGNGARALGIRALAIGTSSFAWGDYSSALGSFATAKNGATVVGLGGYGDGQGLFLSPISSGLSALPTLTWDPYTDRVFRSTSDDRIKVNEVYIENATDTLLKLKPQNYDKLEDIGSSNVIGRESGFMAQDIWYDAPELRHAVYIPPEGCEPTPEKPVASSDDPQDDPDYSAWGEIACDVNYETLIPYLVKSIQELNSRIKVLEGG